MSEFIFAMITAVCGAVLLYYLGKILRYLKGSWREYFRLLSSVGRLHQSGLNYILTARSDYSHMKGGSSISEYISGVSSSLRYIGFWGAKGVEMESINDAIKSLIDKGCYVEFVLLSETLGENQVKTISTFLGITETNLVSRISDAWVCILKIYRELPENQRRLMSIKSHNQIVYSSCFIIDEDKENARILTDIKIFGLNRESSFAFESRKTSNENDLYHRLVKSYSIIADSADLIY